MAKTETMRAPAELKPAISTATRIVQAGKKIDDAARYLRSQGFNIVVQIFDQPE